MVTSSIGTLRWKRVTSIWANLPTAISVPGGTLNGRYEIEGVNVDLVSTMPLGP